ncbi:hypothetical protein BYT27DRAFT_7237672 [Phlegmacium glaucopus]|nr:hypothetical protein BYT27DRAFT_7237672 [Phlegmacium glaucopus]
MTQLNGKKYEWGRNIAKKDQHRFSNVEGPIDRTQICTIRFEELIFIQNPAKTILELHNWTLGWKLARETRERRNLSDILKARSITNRVKGSHYLSSNFDSRMVNWGRVTPTPGSAKEEKEENNFRRRDSRHGPMRSRCKGSASDLPEKDLRRMKRSRSSLHQTVVAAVEK